MSNARVQTGPVAWDAKKRFHRSTLTLLKGGRKIWATPEGGRTKPMR